MFSFIPTEGLLKDSKTFSHYLNLTDLDPMSELYPKNIKKITGNMELDSTPGFEIDEAVFLKSQSYSIEKLKKSIESKQKRIPSHNNFLSESYKNCTGRNWACNWVLFF